MKNGFKVISAFLRLKHWAKNSFVFAPLFFAWMIFDVNAVINAVIAFFAFSLVSSTIYIMNDIHDREADRAHPKKCNRPIAAGIIKVPVAVAVAVILMGVSTGISFCVEPYFIFSTAAYFLLNVFYTFRGKNIVIIDAFCIAMGFVLRVVGGAFAIGVVPSGWIIMTTFFFTLFMGFGKRRNELLSLKEKKGAHRKVLEFYTDTLLNQFILSCGTISIISYTLYTLSATVAEKFHTGDKLVFTIPFVAFVIFRYMYLLWSSEDGDPTDVIFKDPWLLLSGFFWFLSTISIIYVSMPPAV